MEQSIRFDPVARLRTIQAPTLVMWGEQDRLIPFSNAADFVKAIPDVELVALPGTGHLPQEESPTVSLAALMAFLDRPAAH
jgi:pimeloyl-ACP methyl ester carboxylesterase